MKETLDGPLSEARRLGRVGLSKDPAKIVDIVGRIKGCLRNGDANKGVPDSDIQEAAVNIFLASTPLYGVPDR